MDKKGDQLKKAIELIYKLELSHSFKMDIKDIRVRLKVPGASPLLLSIDLLKKYNLPPMYYWEMNQYLQFGKISSLRNKDEEILNINYPDNSMISTGDEQSFIKLKQPYVGIYIHDASSKRDIERIITKNWKDIQKSLRAQGGNISRVRTSTKKEMGRYISELIEISAKDLRKKLNIPASMIISKDALVARVMKARGYEKTTPRMIKRIRETKIMTPHKL